MVIIKNANNKKMLASMLSGYFVAVDFIIIPLSKLTVVEIKVSKNAKSLSCSPSALFTYGASRQKQNIASITSVR